MCLLSLRESPGPVDTSGNPGDSCICLHSTARFSRRDCSQECSQIAAMQQSAAGLFSLDTIAVYTYNYGDSN